jgi:hypothetical protein
MDSQGFLKNLYLFLIFYCIMFNKLFQRDLCRRADQYRETSHLSAVGWTVFKDGFAAHVRLTQ